MPCEGLCHIEQNEWEEERLPHYAQYNGSPHEKSGGGEDPTFPATASDADIWKGEDLSKYKEMMVTLLFSYNGQWTDGVNRKFPDIRRLDCKDPGCICELAKKPTVVEGWTRWRRYEVFVPYVERHTVDGSSPQKIKATRLLLKGIIQHRMRIVRGICRLNPNKTVITPLSEDAPEQD